MIDDDQNIGTWKMFMGLDAAEDAEEYRSRAAECGEFAAAIMRSIGNSHYSNMDDVLYWADQAVVSATEAAHYVHLSLRVEGARLD